MICPNYGKDGCLYSKCYIKDKDIEDFCLLDLDYFLACLLNF